MQTREETNTEKSLLRTPLAASLTTLSTSSGKRGCRVFVPRCRETVEFQPSLCPLRVFADITRARVNVRLTLIVFSKLGVKLSANILAGPTVLSAVGRALRMMA